MCRENPRRSWILLLPDCPRFCRLMKTRSRKYPRSSGMDGDKSGESGAFLFSRRVPDCCDGRRSFPTNESSNLYRRGRGRWISLITNPPNQCWAPVPTSRMFHSSIFGALSFPAKFIGENQRENCGDYPTYLGRSAKSESPDRLGFSRHMKTRLLKAPCRTCFVYQPNPKQLIPSKARQLK